MANKLLKPKRGRVENLPKLAVEDGSLIFAYDTKSPTSTVLVDVGETRYELSAATAKKADNSNALGGSSLQNIVDKIDNATGDGTAFIGLDTTTNNKVKLTRANGTAVEKTVNNVSNASTADYAKISNKIGTGTVGSSTKPVYINDGTPTAISSIPSTFVTAQQINGVNLDTLRTPGMYWAGGGNTNTNKPTGIDAFGLEVLQSAAGWYTQICYASDDQEKQFVRYYNSGTSSWSDWVEQNRLNTKTQSGYAPAPNAANKVYRTDASGNPGWGTLNDSSIGKLASTVTLGDGNNAMIDQNGATYRQRINIFDNATANDAVFSFQQSTDAGKTYKDLFAINDNGTVVASIFQGALKGTADYSKNSGALGGSSLQNIVDKINNSTGNGTAFTGLDTTTNNKVKLTRANGGTVEKTINNVSNASTADYAKSASNAGTAIYLGRNPIARPTNLNIGITGAGGIRTFIANGNITNKAPFDAHIIHLDWDNTGGWDAQIAVEAAKDGHMAVRGMGGSVWGSWNTVLDSANYTSYAAKKNAYNSASVSNATITLGRSDGSTGTTLTVNNVAHASTADLATNSNALGGSSLKNITDAINNSTASASSKFLPLSGGTMTGTITAATGDQKGIKIGNQWITSASDTNGEVVLQGGHLRFGTTAWDYNQWAGLKYNHSNKGIYLGLADGTQFAANSPQSGGSIYTPGIDNIYVGASTSQKVLTTFNYTSTTDGRYVKKSGDIMTGALNLQSAFKGITTQTLSGNTIKTGNNNVTITLPTSNNDTSNAVYMYANQNGPDIGIIYISPDTAFIANSGDAGYVFRVIDKDVNTNTNSNDGMLLGVRQSRGGLDVRSSIFPTNNLTYSLGSSDLNWNNAYASTFHGYLNGVAKDSQALAGSTLAQIIEAAGGVITITKNLKPTVDWLDTGIAGTALSTGTYIVQVSGLSSGNTPGIYSEIWSGVFSWYSGGTNSTNSDEILLHNAGHADNSNELYLRTIRQGATSGGVMKLQMAVKQASTSTVDVTFKFRKMI